MSSSWFLAKITQFTRFSPCIRQMFHFDFLRLQTHLFINLKLSSPIQIYHHNTVEILYWTRPFIYYFIIIPTTKSTTATTTKKRKRTKWKKFSHFLMRIVQRNFRAAASAESNQRVKSKVYTQYTVVYLYSNGRSLHYCYWNEEVCTAKLLAKRCDDGA